MDVNEHFRAVTVATLKTWHRFWSNPGQVAAAVVRGEFTLSETGQSDYEAKSYDPAYEVSIIAAELEARARLDGSGAVSERAGAVRRCFVQFTHPGGEHGPDLSGGKRWNVGLHKRKFLLGRGDYVELPDGEPRQGELVFWGEWEPESQVEELRSTVPGGPRWLHRPYWVPPETYWPQRGSPTPTSISRSRGATASS